MTAVYAFVAWISTIVAYVLFLLWATAPEATLNALGFTYYPSRYYAISLPAYLLTSFLLIGIGYVGINMSNTLAPDDLRTIEDNFSRSAPNYFVTCSMHRENSVPEIGDLDPYVVSLLHLNSKKRRHK